MKINFYGLLYISKRDSNPNLNKKFLNNKIYIYAKNAENLYYSLKKDNCKLTIITNKPKLIKKFLTEEIEIKKIKFLKLIPNSIKFYSSHFKLDLYLFLSKKKEYSGILDLDMLLINKFNKKFLNLIKKKNNLVINLNNKKNKNHNKLIKSSLNICNNSNLNSDDWYGGEFLLGNSDFFKNIYKYSKKCVPNYLNNLGDLHHHGDEMLLNSALQIIKKENKVKFIDVSSISTVERYWSSSTNHKQKKIDYVLKSSLIHLPSDKKFLSSINLKSYSLEMINKTVEKHLKSKKLMFINILKKIYKLFKQL